MSKTTLSMLDLVAVREGGSVAEAIAIAVQTAQHAEQLGFTRYWLAEHHNMTGIASAATSIAIAHVAQGTRTIRVGAGGKAVDTAAEVPEFREFHDRLWAREISLESGDAKVAYGRAHLKQAVVSMRTERFREALRLVSARHGGG